MKKILAIDPSIRNCGYAIMTESKKPKLLKYDLLKSKKKNWLENCENILTQIDHIIYEVRISKIILEYPEFWAGAAGYAARESGAIFKLTFLCGGIYAMYMNQLKVQLVTPSEWKGQLKKEMIRKRLYKIYPDLIQDPEIDHNVIDAIGIGYYTLKEENK